MEHINMVCVKHVGIWGVKPKRNDIRVHVVLIKWRTILKTLQITSDTESD